MSQLIFRQIFPYQPFPSLAVKHTYPIPQRAKMFCHPFHSAAKEGVYAYSPVAFSYLLEDNQIILKLQKSDGTTLTRRFDKSLGAANFIVLEDFAPEISKQCLKQYRQHIDSQKVPEHINVEEFGFYEIMLNVVIEESPFDIYLQIWLGGTMELSSQDGNGDIWIKHPSNVNTDPGFITLDGKIDTQLWQGWLAIVIKPTRKNQWVHISQQQPLCQIVSYSSPIQSLNNIPFEQLTSEEVCGPLDWHIFANDYGIKPGKYLKKIREKTRLNKA